MCGTGTTVSANAPPHRSTTRGFSTAASSNRNDLHLFSGHEPLQKVCMELEKPAQAQNARDDQSHLFLHKMGAKYELGVLKSYINVVLLCIQHLPCGEGLRRGEGALRCCAGPCVAQIFWFSFFCDFFSKIIKNSKQIMGITPNNILIPS